MLPRPAIVAALVVAGALTCNRCPASQPRTLKGHAGVVSAVAFSPDGKTLASASADRTVRLWDAESGELRTTLVGHTEAVSCVDFSPDGRTVASGGHDSQLKLWDAATGQLKATLSGHQGRVRCVTFSADGQKLASGGEDTTIRLWDAKTGHSTATLEGHTSPVLCVAFSPAGDRLASGSGDQSVKLWSVALGCDRTPQLLERREKRGRIVSIVFSPDGDALAFATPDFVSIWDLRRPEHRFSLAARRRGSIRLAQYSPPGTLLATANGADETRSHGLGRKKGNPSRGNEIRLWDAATGHERGSLTGHHGPVRALDFSADGKLLASGSADKTVMIWDVAKFEQPLASASVRQVSATGTIGAGADSNSESASTCVAGDDDALVLLEGGISISRTTNHSASASHGHESEPRRTTWFDYRAFVGGGGGGGGGGFSGGGGKESGEHHK